MSNATAKPLLGIAALVVLLAPVAQRSKPTHVVATSAPASPMKLCIVDEFTHGTSARHQRRAEAETAAVQDWRHNVITSFGDRYSDIRLASNIYGRCWRDDRGLWSCTAQARPCAPSQGVSASIKEPRAPAGQGAR